MPCLPCPPLPGQNMDTTHGEGGIEVFYFPAGQTEAHHPRGLKEIMFADGHVKQQNGKGCTIRPYRLPHDL